MKVTVAPAGAPLELKATAALNPPERLVEIVELPELPRATGIEAGEAEMAKSATATVVTVSVTVTVCVLVPPVAVTVIG